MRVYQNGEMLITEYVKSGYTVQKCQSNGKTEIWVRKDKDHAWERLG